MIFQLGLFFDILYRSKDKLVDLWNQGYFEGAYDGSIKLDGPSDLLPEKVSCRS